jgi:hypothetical protein
MKERQTARILREVQNPRANRMPTKMAIRTKKPRRVKVGCIRVSF